MPKNWFPTLTGKKILIDDPDPELIEILDLAHSLSNLCRYNGHCNRFYSVAQHSVLVERCLRERFDITDSQILRTALLHDTGEFSTGDMIYPGKKMLQKVDEFIADLRAMEKTGRFRFGQRLEDLVTFHEMERRAEAALVTRFNLVWPFPPVIHKADLAVTAMERDNLFTSWPEWVIDAEPFPSVELIAWRPEHAKEMFLSRYAEL